MLLLCPILSTWVGLNCPALIYHFIRFDPIPLNAELVINATPSGVDIALLHDKAVAKKMIQTVNVELAQ